MTIENNDIDTVKALEAITLNQHVPSDVPLIVSMTQADALALAEAIEGQEFAFMQAHGDDWVQLVAHMSDEWKTARRPHIDEQAKAFMQDAITHAIRMEKGQRWQGEDFNA